MPNESALDDAPPETRIEPRVGPIMTGLLELYLDLHLHPELSGAERRTAALLADRLDRTGYTVTTGIGGHGVLGVLRNGPGPAVLLRTELDALPVLERTALPYASAQDGAMHACGHDAHIACAAGAATLLADSAEQWQGTVIVVGQPAEEELSGAAAMLADGLYERSGRPDVILAQHLTPLPAGLVAHAAAAVTAASLTMELRIHGRGGHGGLPHLAANPIPVAAAIIADLETIPTRQPAIVTVGVINAGSRANIIPDQATLGISLRAATQEALDRAAAEVSRIAEARCAEAGFPRSPEVVRLAESPAGTNDPVAAGIVRTAHERAFGAGRIATLPPSMATDDFPLFATPDGGEPIPSVYWMLGSTGHSRWAAAPGSTAIEKVQGVPANHSAEFAPDPIPTLRTGTAAMTAAVLGFLRSTT